MVTGVRPLESNSVALQSAYYENDVLGSGDFK